MKKLFHLTNQTNSIKKEIPASVLFLLKEEEGLNPKKSSYPPPSQYYLYT